MSTMMLAATGIIAVISGCAPHPGQTELNAHHTSTALRSATSVFVLGGIHQTHERAKKYTYDRMGEVFEHLRPDVLCVEIQQKYLDDGSEKGMPYDFKKFVVPLARKRRIPIVGIDWWDETRGRRWQELQQKAFSDPSLRAEAALIGGIFELLNGYFAERDFQEINSAEISAIWQAKSELKYRIYRKHSEYRSLWAFEKERNDRMVANVARVVARNPQKRVLVAVGIDHKYYLERALRDRGVKVLTAKEAMAEWWR